jgi:DNA-binding CsgD family transcriptional regulator
MNKPPRVPASNTGNKLPAKNRQNDATVISVSPPPEMKPRAKALKTTPAPSVQKKPRASTKPAPKGRSRRTTIPMLAFTPGNQDPFILEELFVRREGLLQELERDVEEFANGGSRRHRLLVGPRGIGKSHLIALLNHRVTNSEVAENISVHMLPEDLYGITRFADLVDAILNRDPQPRKSNAEAETELRAIAASEPMLILLENLDSVLHTIGPDGVHHLRSAIEDSKILLIATSPLLFDEVQKAKAPLFGFFDTIHLDELSVDDALELMRRVAKLRGEDELLEFLDTPQARARAAAVQALAGGQPRIWMLFTGCLSVQALDELVPLFMESLDDLTPYYQSRVGSLSPQLQQIVMMFCRQGSALSNKAIAEGTGIDERRVATAMKDLERKGYVRKPTSILESVGDERISWWDLREPLMRLSLDVKSSRGKPLRTILEFLRLWYGLDLYLVPFDQVGPTTQIYVQEALDDLHFLQNTKITPVFLSSLSEFELNILKANAEAQSVRLREKLETSRAKVRENDATIDRLRATLLKSSEDFVASAVEEATLAGSLPNPLFVAHVFALVIDSCLDPSRLLELFDSHPNALALGLAMSIPFLGPWEKVSRSTKEIVWKLETTTTSDFAPYLDAAVSWMRTRNHAELMAIPVEWRGLFEVLLSEWSTNQNRYPGELDMDAKRQIEREIRQRIVNIPEPKLLSNNRQSERSKSRRIIYKT